MNCLHFNLSILFSLCCGVFANEDFIKANNLFTSKLYKETSKTEKGSFVVSPFSAEAVLIFTLFGTRGRTFTELRRALHILSTDDAETKLPQQDILFLANKMYIQDNFTITNEFKDVASKIFDAESESIDFSDTTEAADTINTWVEEITDNTTQNIISADILNNKTRLILINTLYLQANWSKSDFIFYDCDHLDAKFLELPMPGYEASVVVVVPKKQGLVALEKEIRQVFSPKGLTPSKEDVVLPKFTIQSVIDLKKILEKLGVKLLFDKNRADLSGISGRKSKLFVGEVLQKSFIDVGDGGIEASVGTYDASAAGRKSYVATKQLFSDQSFIFYIKYKEIIIFAGRVGQSFY